LGSYLPRVCGIATFNHDLCEAVAAETGEGTGCFAVAMNDIPEGYRYPERVRFEIRQNVLGDYARVADFLNMNLADVVFLQHEFGIFGGPAGEHLLALLAELRMPVITALHTVLKDPSPEQRRVVQELIRLSSRLVVMSERAMEFLRRRYRAPAGKVVLIHHGIPDLPFVDPNFYKDQFGVAGRQLLLSFGLLSPGKGLEYAIDALAKVVAKHPDVVYMIVGATHPHVKRRWGEEYRLSLQRRAEEHGVADHLVFQNRFVELTELCEFLGAADLYLTPYLNREQVVSGTLAYAMGAGKAVISTPYWYAEEMLRDDRGRLVPFRDAEALAEQISDLLARETARHAIRRNAYTFCRQMVWKEVARAYLAAYEDAVAERDARPQLPFRARPVEEGRRQLPDVDLRHLRLMTDETGILQHARFAVPNRGLGYTTDDNARALIVALRAHEMLGEADLLRLATIYLGFLDAACNSESGRFRNFLSYERRWLEEVGSEDSHSRALWGVGVAVALSPNDSLEGCALHVFSQALPAAEQFTSPRSWAFALVGVHAYLRRFGGDSGVRRVRESLALRLYRQFHEHATEEWPWLEDSLNYANGKLVQALLLSGQWLSHGKMVEQALRSLGWLLRAQTAPEGHLSPVGNRGWFHRGGTKAHFDQQPLEVHALLEACLEAYNVTQDSRWLGEANRCLDWFLGRNDLSVSLYDHATGGCRDGLGADGANQNQGAESTLAWLLSLLAILSTAVRPPAPEQDTPKAKRRTRQKSR
jgi:glycosyltransferase involved in cell wall biosynthesis